MISTPTNQNYQGWVRETVGGGIDGEVAPRLGQFRTPIQPLQWKKSDEGQDYDGDPRVHHPSKGAFSRQYNENGVQSKKTARAR